MAVYVGKLFPTEYWSKRWPFPYACHLLADTEQELDEFATNIDLKRLWKQQSGTYKCHYDITAGMRKRAVQEGAIEMSPYEETRFLIARREEERACTTKKRPDST